MDLSRLDSEQTIVALFHAAPAADRPSLRCIVRLSGPDGLRIASGLLEPQLPRAHGRPSVGVDGPGFAVERCLLLLGPSLRLPIEVYRFRAGRSYTGQDMLELHLPGSAALAEQVLDSLVAAGARPAEPGEFTLRAVLSGRIDLTGAEAVAELIAARGDGQLRAAMQLAEGRLARSVRSISDRVADLLAEVEAGLDFADEPLEFITPGRLRTDLARARGDIAELARNAGSFETLEHRPAVALIGRPNVGKSTLLNRLTQVARALCSPLAGTTRDVLAAPLPLQDGEALLLDVAGLEASVEDADFRSRFRRDGGAINACENASDGASDPDQLAQQAARQVAATADVLVVVLDAACPLGLTAQLALLDEWGIADRPRVVVCNKIDIASAAQDGGAACRSTLEVLPVSGATGAGLEALKVAINGRLFAAAARPGEQLMLNARHRSVLVAADEALARAERLMRGDGQGSGLAIPSADLVAQELREGLSHLGQISGEMMTEDVLGRIFSRFCVGK